jgi:uncharacterized protein
MDPKPHHKPRHRKKLRLGEFRELGFAVSATCPADWDDARRDTAMGALLQLCEARGLDYGGGDSASGMDGYVVRAGRGSADEADRDAVRAELSRLGFTEVQAGDLEDAWHPAGGD